MVSNLVRIDSFYQLLRSLTTKVTKVQTQKEISMVKEFAEDGTVFLTWWSKCEILHILDPFLLCALLTIEVLSEFICPKKNVTFGPNALCDNYTCLVFIILLTKLL